jgi:AcrR family transcriptional regulator
MLTSARSRLPGVERRAAIIEAAIRLFAERGFRGTTTRDLAAAVGVTEPVLYQHFPTKSALYEAILETKAAEGREMMDAALGPYLNGDDDRGFFTHLALLIQKKFARDPAFVRLLLFSALEGHALADAFYRRQMLEFHSMIAGYIERRMSDGAFRRVDPWIAARSFINMAAHQGLLNELWPRHQKRISRSKYIDAAVSIWLDGMSGPRRGAS